MKMKLTIAAATFYVIYWLVLNFVINNDEKFHGEKFSTGIKQNSALLSFHSHKIKRSEISTVVIDSVAMGTEVKVLEGEIGRRFKIVLPNGNIGWVKNEEIDIAPYMYVCYPKSQEVGIWKDPAPATGMVIKYLTYPIAVTCLDTALIENDNTEYQYIKVVTFDGNEGWIKSSDVIFSRLDSRIIPSKKIWRFNGKLFVESLINKPFSLFFQKFGEPDAVLKTAINSSKYFYYNIVLYENRFEESAIQIITKNDTIGNIYAVDKYREPVSYFPLSEHCRIFSVMNSFWDVFDLFYVPVYSHFDKNFIQNFNSKEKWIGLALTILIFVGFFSFAFVVIYVPYFISDKLLYSISLSKRIPNGVLLFLVFFLSIMSGYFYFLFINLNFGIFNTNFIPHLAAAVLINVLFIRKRVTEIKFDRCPKCHYWSGSDYVVDILDGEDEQEAEAGERDVSRGKGKKKKIRRRACLNSKCGHEWEVN